MEHNGKWSCWDAGELGLGVSFTAQLSRNADDRIAGILRLDERFCVGVFVRGCEEWRKNSSREVPIPYVIPYRSIILPVILNAQPNLVY